MPHIGVVMEQSLQERTFREGLVDLIARSLAGGLGKRQLADVQNGVSDFKTAISSWDNCMAANFCKWPVIGIIIVGGLIIFSIVWCCARCLCCGVSCCCECCYCLKCCGQCCGMCDAPRGKRSKYLDEPYVPPHHDQAYRSQPNMDSGFPPARPAKAEPPQYAVFDDGPKKDADSLPAMPSWEDAGSKKVLLEEEDSVEMEPLKKPESTPAMQMNALNASQTTVPNATSPEARSPFGTPAGQAGPNGYMAAGNANANPYASNGQSYDSYNDAGYGQGSQGYSDQGYGVGGTPGQGPQQQQDYNNAGYYGGQLGQGYPQSRTPRPYDVPARRGTPGAYGMGPGRQTPAGAAGFGAPPRVASPAQAGYGYDDTGRRPSPGPNAAYGYSDAGRKPSPGPNAAYGYGQRSNTPGSYGQGPNMAGGYGQRSNTPGSQARPYPPPQRQYSADTNQQYPQDSDGQYPADSAPQFAPPRRQYTGGSTHQYQPQREYSSDSVRPLARPSPGLDNSQPSSPITNNSGFDFTSGFSRPTPTPPPTQTANGGKAYPGYRPYKPPQQEDQAPQQTGWSGV